MGFLNDLLKALTGGSTAPPSRRTPPAQPKASPTPSVRHPTQPRPSPSPPRTPSPKRKADWQRLEQIVKANGITTLYHFTDQANLESIRRCGGLYSWEYCETKKVGIPRPGGNHLSRSLDSRRGLGDYVRLSFVRSTPMLYIARSDGRLQRPFILEIDPEVIYWEDTLFSDGNATANRAWIGGKMSDFQRIRFDVLRKPDWTTEEEKHYWQAEVLVKRHVPLRYIRNL